jgi:hypothetical protein
MVTSFSGMAGLEGYSPESGCQQNGLNGRRFHDLIES